MTNPRKIDETDRKILNILQKNSRVTIKELSERLNLSTTPIHERIKKLEKNGYIKNYITLIDPKMVGKGLSVYISVSLKDHAKETVEEFEKQMNRLDEVMECYYISGNFDFLLKIQCSDMDDYHQFITQKFSTIKNITQFYSSFVMLEAKMKYDFKL
ncbi:MAG TPA: Lrp/AsnC family transcriptional regulator [Tenuifilaceae bacterium]|nr:Lrp/AsnC family transcriptional regulator [Tenuifilaceae bacterium]HPE17188.1 Lrp/AsnC family transcriptional regulator [Tenuifilaceae bacterium]HPJ44764.1 Lrp/AsnC family transcriptional regulator [Tenuifilaceae bacterium]HPQ33300.1 Lrp/AsnC family transcriptional regulator [Tenuifilaceae bacterium]HRX67587.1 Lrp/AsnC family transcriptional regulator [Tenuifilaceae bacterium]